MTNSPGYNIPQINYRIKTAIIIGGGLAGSSAAYSLAKRGWDITLIEREGNVGQGASGNPVGIITPLISHSCDPIGEFYYAGFHHTLTHLQSLIQRGYKISMQTCGVTDISSNKLNKNLQQCIIPDSQITRQTPQEASMHCGIKIPVPALHMPKAGWVDPTDLCNANMLAAKDHLKIIKSQNISSLQQSPNGWTVYDKFHNIISKSTIVIIANAHNASDFTQTKWLPIQPVRGQLTYFSHPSINTKNIICYDGGYITPIIDRHNYVGATFSRDNMSSDISDADHISNIENLKSALDLSSLTIESRLQGRVSFRATMPDRRPVIGAVPDYNAYCEDYFDLHHGRTNTKYPPATHLKGLYISTGYGSRGLSACPIGGEILASMINNEPPPVTSNITKLINPARFIMRSLIKRSKISNTHSTAP